MYTVHTNVSRLIVFYDLSMIIGLFYEFSFTGPCIKDIINNNTAVLQYSGTIRHQKVYDGGSTQILRRTANNSTTYTDSPFSEIIQ